jgi:hypothetical protein
MSDKSQSGHAKTYMTKKCPYCYVYLELAARRCHICNKRIGDVDKLGFAAKPFNWSGYLISILLSVALCIFVWWGFFRE